MVYTHNSFLLTFPRAIFVKGEFALWLDVVFQDKASYIIGRDTHDIHVFLQTPRDWNLTAIWLNEAIRESWPGIALDTKPVGKTPAKVQQYVTKTDLDPILKNISSKFCSNRTRAYQALLECKEKKLPISGHSIYWESPFLKSLLNEEGIFKDLRLHYLNHSYHDRQNAPSISPQIYPTFPFFEETD